MIDKRVRYGIDNFLEDNFFLPSGDSYCLEEKSESGRSELLVKVQGDNLCSEDYDHKGKCNFLKKNGKMKLQKSVDHVLLQKKEERWILHFIEMKSKVDNKKWREIKQKIRASYFNFCALERVLGIHIDEVKTYTTYEKTGFWNGKDNEDPKTRVPLLGGKMPPLPENEWKADRINVDIGEVGELAEFHHKAVRMQRSEDGTKLMGNLMID